MQAIIVMDGTPEEIALLVQLVRDENTLDIRSSFGATEERQEESLPPMGFKAARIKAGLSQENVATCVGVGRSAVAMWETGKTKPRTEMLPKLAALFGCTVDEMLTDQSTQDVDKPDK